MNLESDCLNIGIDLGSDTLKLAFVFKNSQRELVYGKFSDPVAIMAGLPAQAQFIKPGDSASKGRWIYADQIACEEENSFVTVVKIKKLISLLSKISQGDNDAINAQIAASNRNYYLNRSVFPKFAFPDKQNFMQDVTSYDFSTYEEKNKTFTAQGYTPKAVCEGFFGYIAAFVEKKIKKLEKMAKTVFPREKIRYAVVYPPKVGAEYIDEVCRLVELAFHKKPIKQLSSTKALAFYAYHEKLMKPGDDALLFDLGEETISVAKARLTNDNNVVVDGTDGHMPPRDVGGVDVDEAIAAYLDQIASQGGTIGGINEEMLYSKQYELANDIKCMKALISESDFETNFPSGISINVQKEVAIKCQCTKKEILKCIVKEKRINTKNGMISVGDYIAKYFVSEIKQPVNANTKKMFIAGGLSEFKPLMEYIIKRIKEEKANMEVYTFDLRESDRDDEFAFSQSDDGVFAPAIGGALVAYLDYDIKMVYALSYGTFARNASKDITYFDILVNRGDASDAKSIDNVNSYYWNITNSSFTDHVSDGVMYTCTLCNSEIKRLDIPNLTDEIKKKHFINTGSLNAPEWVLTDKNDPEHSELAKLISFRSANKPKNGRENKGDVHFYYNNRRVSIKIAVNGTVLPNKTELCARSGLKIEPSGKATRCIKNATDRGHSYPINIKYLDPTRFDYNIVAPFTIDISELELRFEVVEEFSLENDD